jgi:4a-hydroxytetrahydrobiopterin dehydratase
MHTLTKKPGSAVKALPHALGPARSKVLFSELSGGWSTERHRLEKKFVFKDFREALAFTNKVGALAEDLEHHPDVRLGYGEVTLSLSTHSVHGLTEKDFILASRIDKL